MLTIIARARFSVKKASSVLDWDRSLLIRPSSAAPIVTIASIQFQSDKVALMRMMMRDTLGAPVGALPRNVPGIGPVPLGLLCPRGLVAPCPQVIALAGVRGLHVATQWLQGRPLPIAPEPAAPT